MRVAILGSGAWGTTLAIIQALKGNSVTLWEHHSERAAAMRRERMNTPFLPGVPLPETIVITDSLKEALTSAEVVIFVTPTQKLRANAILAAKMIHPDTLIICGSKGIEIDTFARVSQILTSTLPPFLHRHIAVLSGPNLAHEIVEGKPAASVIAAHDAEAAERAQHVLTTATMRIYSTDDVTGVEIGGAMKNVIAIGIGAGDGLGFGDNAKATLMTRGLAEIERLAVAEGGNRHTLAGLAGLGDLIATCSSSLSRNYSLGKELVMSGRTLSEILADRNSVAEGVMTARAALQMATAHNIQMPITQALCRLFEGADPRTLVTGLMQRESRAERDHQL